MIIVVNFLLGAVCIWAGLRFLVIPMKRGKASLVKCNQFWWFGLPVVGILAMSGQFVLAVCISALVIILRITRISLAINCTLSAFQLAVDRVIGSLNLTSESKPRTILVPKIGLHLTHFVLGRLIFFRITADQPNPQNQLVTQLINKFITQ